MDILLVSKRFPPAPGGLEDQVAQIARRMVEKGHRVEVYSSDLYKDAPFQRMSQPLSTSQNRISVNRFKAIPIPGIRRRVTSLAPTMLLACLGRRDLPDVVHCHGLDLVALSASYAIGRRPKLLCTTHADPSVLSEWYFARILARFDGLVALTKREQTQMLRLGIDASRIRVIPSGIDVGALTSLPAPDFFRRKTRSESHLILYVGRIELSKGCHVLVQAVSLAQHRIGDCTIVFAGPDWGAQKYLELLSHQKGVRVVFTGNLTTRDLGSVLVASDVLVLPSFAEALSVSVLEAMFCGTPVVATRVGGIPSIVRNEETGLLVSTGDAPGLADAICRILEDRQLTSRMVANAKKLASEYSVENTVRKLERFYLDILETH
jgi:glycosyltransferase involved in cell wall biosynthesis